MGGGMIVIDYKEYQSIYQNTHEDDIFSLERINSEEVGKGMYLIQKNRVLMVREDRGNISFWNIKTAKYDILIHPSRTFHPSVVRNFDSIRGSAAVFSVAGNTLWTVFGLNYPVFGSNYSVIEIKTIFFLVERKDMIWLKIPYLKLNIDPGSFIVKPNDAEIYYLGASGPYEGVWSYDASHNKWLKVRSP